METKTFGGQLLKARKLAKMSRRELSEKSGISTTQIGRYENDDSEPTVSAMNKLAQALQISPIDLMPIETLSLDFNENEDANLNSKARLSVGMFLDNGGNVFIDDSFLLLEEKKLIRGIKSLLIDYFKRHKATHKTLERLVNELELTNISLILKPNNYPEEDLRKL